MISIKINGLDELKKKVESQSQSFKSKGQTFLLRLAKEGLNVARAEFNSAQYDGTNDVTVMIEIVGKNKVAVVANGQAVAFIEFGTGIHYTEQHPKADEMGAVRGGYGKGKGNNDSWTYYGETGTSGTVIKETDKGTVVRTKGNPPARAMYDASQKMIEKIQEIAREVFIS